MLVDGPQALPDLVAPVIPSPEHVLYVVASREMQEPLVRGRGSGVASQVRAWMMTPADIVAERYPTFPTLLPLLDLALKPAV